jgi:hypothetical protein
LLQQLLICWMLLNAARRRRKGKKPLNAGTVILKLNADAVKTPAVLVQVRQQVICLLL